MAETARVAVAQMDMRSLAPDAFFARLRDIGAAAAAQKADFLVFPEWYVLQILAAERRRTPAEAMERLCDLAGDLVDTLGAIATGSGINVIGGAHPASVAVHRSAGFVSCGTMKATGFKFGRWLDTELMQKPLGEGADSTPDEKTYPGSLFAG